MTLYRGDEGSRTFINKRYLRSGSYSGVKVLDVNSTYYWKPIEATTLSLCIVVAEDETESRLETVSSKTDCISYIISHIFYLMGINVLLYKHTSACAFGKTNNSQTFSRVSIFF